MPELPEVEYAAESLRAWLKGKTLVAAQVAPSPILRGASAPALERLLVGRKVSAVDRRGKWLRLSFSDGSSLYSHLGMTGKWVKRRPSDGPDRFERARLDVRGASVRYLDMRLFGRLVAAPHGEILAEWAARGPDPLVDGIDEQVLAERLAKTRRSIKETLMDQSVLAGIGNIQASESLWRARIHPGTSSPSVARDPKRVHALKRAILDSIQFTLNVQKRENEIQYVEEAGTKNPFKVYGRAGERCPRKDGTIRRVVQGGRSTFYCPGCQRR